MSDYNKSRGGTDGERRPMFSATCANCGKPCEVPFRPSGDRPVYCKECFRAKQESSQGGAPQKKFTSAPRPPRVLSQPADSLAAQLGSMNAKLDKIIALLSSSAPTSSAPRKTAGSGAKKKSGKPAKPRAKKK